MNKHFLWVCLLLSACAQQSSAPVYQRNVEGMQAELNSLERQIKAVVGYPRCDSFTDCDALPIGYAACGGPSEYRVYSKQMASVSYLRDLARQRSSLQRAYNSAADIVGTCMIEIKPHLTCRAGTCRKI